MCSMLKAACTTKCADSYEIGIRKEWMMNVSRWKKHKFFRKITLDICTLVLCKTKWRCNGKFDWEGVRGVSIGLVVLVVSYVKEVVSWQGFCEWYSCTSLENWSPYKVSLTSLQLRMLVMNACRALLNHQSLLRLVLLQPTADISNSTSNLDTMVDDTSQSSEVSVD